MNTEKITYYIQHPEFIELEDIKTINEIKSKFPYCSTIHTLYLKGLANCNSIEFDDELKKSSIQVNNRERLYEIIHEIVLEKNTIKIHNKETKKNAPLKKQEDKEINEPFTKEESKKTEIKTQTDKQESTLTSKLKNTTLKKQTTTKTSDLIQKQAKNNEVDMAKIIEDIRLKAEAARLKKKTTTADSSSNIENKTEPKEEQNKPHKEETNNQTKDNQDKEINIEFNLELNEKSDLEIDILSNAMTEAFELDVDNIIRESDYTEPTLSKEKNISTNIESESENTIDINTLSFIDWLKYKQGKLEQKPIEKETIEEPIKLTKKEVDKLLNKFIEEEPKMSKPQKEFYNPLKNAKQSLDDTTVLVSETLAKIYWMQKKYSKAIKAYEQLSLRNPEKNTFFANQIKKIKQELNKL